ncbi:hypothetical protein [Polaribacter sp. Hel_I_88]|uniref:hypothetical protein n=1 Tax=Polaribacter sp. Hel_I_88 TaxID=1250006 RepID=UPI00047B3515|nr:hypothetical protein [Polaribacter sp. Hel_I_88]
METIKVKNGILDALKGILAELNLKEVEDLQDMLSIQMHKLTDNGNRVSLADLKKELDIE